MYLTDVHIQHFRSLFDVRLQLKPLTIFIGPNAGGKSNLFKALRFLHDGVAGDRLVWEGYDSQIDDLLWYGLDELGKRPADLVFKCQFGSSDNSAARYDVVLSCNDYLKVKSEELAVALPNELELHTFFTRRGTRLRQLIGQRGKLLRQPYSLQARSPRTLTMREQGPDLRLSQAQAVYNHIRGWRFFNVALALARQEAFVPHLPDAVPPLADDAANLSAFLYALWRLRPTDFDVITDALSNMVDLPDKLLVEHDAERGGQSARYFFIEKPFGEERHVPPQSMSDGAVRLLAYLALLIGDDSVKLACLEEPDHGLHPRLMLHLADILRQTVAIDSDEEAETAPQILLTTHSPEFMDCFDLEEEQDYLQVYIVDRDDEGKTVAIPASAEEFAPWLERYRLGEAVRRRLV